MLGYNLDNKENRSIVESCYRTNKILINPLIDWDDEFLWWYIKHENIEINPKYQCGSCRIGCIGCPMAGKERWEHFSQYPQYKELYINAFQRMVDARKAKNLSVRKEWENGLKVFKWWMEDENCDGQYSFDYFGNITEDYT